MAAMRSNRQVGGGRLELQTHLSLRHFDRFWPSGENVPVLCGRAGGSTGPVHVSVEDGRGVQHK